jgi:glyoxylase-like metal-dependent hydrolase (beta-lactamase superfamily II)
MTIISRSTLLVLTFAAVLAAGVMGHAQDRRTAAAVPVKLYVFDGGILESDPTRYHLTTEEVTTSQLSVASYLIVHPKGTLVWDTGAVGDSEWKPTGSPVVHRLMLPDGQPRQVTLKEGLLTQLAAAGYKPSGITYLALSHYHWDHTANANAFAGSTWIARKVERDTMFANLPPGTYRPMTYSALRKSKTVLVQKDDDYDVFKDGTVVIKSAAGHTVGHQVLYVKLPNTGGVVLSGDLYHYPEERTLGRYPTFDFSEMQTRASRQQIDAFLKKADAQLWIQHDLAAFAKLKKSPAYYD